MSSIKKIQRLLEEAQAIAKDELGLENIFYNERFVEMFMADALGHTYGNNTQGGDAIDQNDKPVEYKAINQRSKSKSGTFQFHWLSENKIAKYGETDKMFFAIRDGVTLDRVYELPTSTVMPILEAKATGDKSIHGHAGFNEKKLKSLGAKVAYSK
mgnify:FL=1